MKQTLLSILTLLAIGTSINAQNVNIPDANFKAYLVGNTAINTNNDTEIQVSEATAFTGQIDCSFSSISDLTGIEAFTASVYLDCSNNQLTSLDVTNNTALIDLYGGFNQITSLDLSANTALTYFSFHANQLTSLDVTSTTTLSQLSVQGNQLTSLVIGTNNISNNLNATNNPNLTCIQVDDVAYSTTNWTNIDAASSFSTNCPPPCTVTIPDVNFKAYLVGNIAINTNGNTEIECSEATTFTGYISCQSQSISDLTGIEAFTNITRLYCFFNSLTTLDVSTNTALTRLYCQGNSLTTLDVSTNTALSIFYCEDNSLTNLNVANGNNTNFIGFAANNNPNLTCITVDGVAYSTANWSSIDAQTSFSTNCNVPCTVTIPDANFKTYLVGNTAINTNGDTEIQCSEATAFTGAINCANQSISDFTGIEAFIAITNLYCSNNSLTTLNVSNNTALIQLSCSHNLLTTLNVSSNTVLTDLYCFYNSLTNLNVANGNNTNFIGFVANNNPNLTCITVDNVAYSTTNWTNIDAASSFSTNCSVPCTVTIPDANFKA